MNSCCRILLCAFSSILLAGTVVGQTLSSRVQYPTQPIRMVVPWPAGGTTDVIARLLGHNLTADLGQTVVIENIGGAGGNIGTQKFVRAKPDGYTMLMASSSTNVANPHLYKNLGFEPIMDFTPIALVARVPSVLVVGADSPFRSVSDIISSSKTKPEGLSYASAGVGSSAHLAGELLKNVTKISVTHVPYKGIAPAVIDVMSGRIAYTFDTGITANIEGGKLRPLAVASSERVRALPDVPTFDESGVKGMYMTVWFGIAGPGNMSKELVTTINEAVNNALVKGQLPERLRNLGSDLKPTTAEAFTDFWRTELARYADIVRLSGAVLD
jgi:tripartite-type tricarboxylate transporter receptor subunit TctC